MPGKPSAARRRVDGRGDHAEVLGDQRQRRRARRAAASNGARPGPRCQRPRQRVAGAARHRPVGDEAAEVVDPREVVELERAPQALDPPAVAAALQRRPVVQRVAPQLALVGVRVGRRAGHRVVAEQLRVGAVVGRPGRDVDRHVADQLHAALLGVRAQRRPLAVEPHLVGDRAARVRPVVDPVRVALAEVQLGRLAAPARAARRAARARRRTPTPTCTASRAVGRAERQHLPPRLARVGQPVDERVRLAARAGRRGARWGAAGRRWNERGSCRARSSDTPRQGCPHPSAAEAPARIRINHPAPTVDGGRYPAKRCVGDTVTGRRRRLLATATRSCAPSSATRRPARAAGSRRRCTPIDAHINGVRWEGEFTVETRGPLGVDDRGVDRPVRHLARRAAAQGRRRPGRPRGRALRGRRAARGRAPRAPRAATTARRSSTRSTRCKTRRRGRPRRRWRRDLFDGDGARRRSATARRGCRQGAAARGRPRAGALRRPGTSCSRARGAA